MNGFWRDSALLIPTIPIGVTATGILTSDNVANSDGDTVTIGTQVYTFKTALTDGSTHPGEVLIGANADASLTNLKNAINGAGTPGTDYDSSTPKSATVTSGAVIAHAITLTAISPGFAGNKVVTTKSATHLSWGDPTLAGGVGGPLKSVLVDVAGAGGETINTDPISVGQYSELMALINVSAHAGTNPTLDCKMQYSDDAAPSNPAPTWMDSGDSFTQITTSNALVNKKMTANFGKWIRFVLALGGTDPSYTFSLTLAAKS